VTVAPPSCGDGVCDYVSDLKDDVRELARDMKEFRNRVDDQFTAIHNENKRVWYMLGILIVASGVGFNALGVFFGI